MIVVLDASAALELAFNREHADRIQDFLNQADYVIAPDLYISEVSNTLWKYARIAGNIIDIRVLDDAVSLPDDFVPTRTLYREAFALGVRAAHPIYDCMYLVTARRNSAMLVTLDQQLMTLATAERVQVFSR